MNIPSDIDSLSPLDIIRWSVGDFGDDQMMISTNFRPYEAVLLHMAVQVVPDIPVLWVDHGYNTRDTYLAAEKTIELLKLNVKLYIPTRTAAHRDAVLGGVPSIDDEAKHSQFTEEVKLEPFRRGVAEINRPGWLTALRRVQNPNREGMQVIEPVRDGLVKISPVLTWTDADMEAYISEHKLPNEANYYDPTKVLEKRECGLHLDSSKL